MSWFFVDDGFYDHPKLALLTCAERWPAIGLWTSAGTWSRKKLTGGAVPHNQVEALGCTHEIAASLVKCELWVRTDSGYQFHDWAQWQETPEEVEIKRAESKERSRAWRKSKAEKSAKKPSRRTNSVRTAYERSANAPRTLREPGEGDGEGESTCSTKLEVRDKLAVGAETPASLAVLARLKAVR